MIKNLIRKILMLSALIILAAHTVPSIMNNMWEETSFLWELVLLTGFICIAQLLLERFKSDYYILEVIMEYLMVCLIVSATGLIFNWFEFSFLWMVFIYVTPVYIIGYFLDLVRTRRDVDFINEKIKQRMDKAKNGESKE